MSVPRTLAKIAWQFADAGALADTVAVLRAGRLTASSGATTVAEVASGRVRAEEQLRALLDLWQRSLAGHDSASLAFLLEAIDSGIQTERSASPINEVVWTGPNVEGSFLRATRQVVQDIVQAAERELLVVGYWLAGQGEGEGIVNDVVNQIAEALRRGVAATFVLDERDKSYGKNNREILLDLWPSGLDAPRILTWKLPEDDQHLKLHAKVLVADRRDSLVTSANLTMYALDRNMEMGIRVKGATADRIAQHFDLLRQREVLVSFDP